MLGILGEAAAAALVREVADAPGRFVFTHALVQHAILVNLGATREAALHRRVAEVLEAGGDLRLPGGRARAPLAAGDQRLGQQPGPGLGPASRRRRTRRRWPRVTPSPTSARRSCCTTSCATTTSRRASTC